MATPTNQFKGMSEEETRACVRFFLEYGRHMAPAMPLVMWWLDLVTLKAWRT